MNKIIAILIVLLSFSLMLSGCTEAETTITTDDGDVTLNTSTDGQEYSATVNTDEGTTEIQGSGGDSSSWCQTGANWNMNTTGSENDGSMDWEIEGIEESGKYAGYCHVVYAVDTENAQGNIEYYFDEEGSGFMVMNINGQKIESEWTGSN
jgi:hypothetical protein